MDALSSTHPLPPIPLPMVRCSGWPTSAPSPDAGPATDPGPLPQRPLPGRLGRGRSPLRGPQRAAQPLSTNKAAPTTPATDSNPRPAPQITLATPSNRFPALPGSQGGGGLAGWSRCVCVCARVRGGASQRGTTQNSGVTQGGEGPGWEGVQEAAHATESRCDRTRCDGRCNDTPRQRQMTAKGCWGPRFRPFDPGALQSPPAQGERVKRRLLRTSNSRMASAEGRETNVTRACGKGQRRTPSPQRRPAGPFTARSVPMSSPPRFPKKMRKKNAVANGGEGARRRQRRCAGADCRRTPRHIAALSPRGCAARALRRSGQCAEVDPA